MALGNEQPGQKRKRQDEDYSLQAVVRHQGSTPDVGHYTCDIRASIGTADNVNTSSASATGASSGHSRWLRCNDAVTTVVDEVSNRSK
jgi:hypothetical protein